MAFNRARQPHEKLNFPGLSMATCYIYPPEEYHIVMAIASILVLVILALCYASILFFRCRKGTKRYELELRFPLLLKIMAHGFGGDKIYVLIKIIELFGIYFKMNFLKEDLIICYGVIPQI